MTISSFARSRTAAVVAGAALLVAGGGAVASGTLASADSQDRGVHRTDRHSHGVLKLIRHRLEADGPYPGLTQLQEGDNSTDLWVADGGATLQRSWVQCAPARTPPGAGSANGTTRPTSSRTCRS